MIAFLDNFPCKVNTTHASSTRLTCISSAATKPQTINAMHLMIDGSNRSLAKPFTYKSDPTIAEIKPLISFLSGGRMITVHGTNFDIIQKPEMVVYVDSDFFRPINKTVSVIFLTKNLFFFNIYIIIIFIGMCCYQFSSNGMPISFC